MNDPRSKHKMTTHHAEKLRKLALSITQGNLRRPWSIQTSDACRRIGTDRDDVLCAVTRPTDELGEYRPAPPFKISRRFRFI